EVYPLEHLAHGVYDRCEVEVARGHFVEHGGEDEEVLAVDQRDLNVRVASQRFLQLHRRVKAGEATAQDQNPFWLICAHVIRVVGVRLAVTSELFSPGRARPNGTYRGATSQNTLMAPVALVSFSSSSE